MKTKRKVFTVGDKQHIELDNGEYISEAILVYTGVATQSAVFNIHYRRFHKVVREDSGTEELILSYEFNEQIFMPKGLYDNKTVVSDMLFECYGLEFNRVSVTVKLI